MNAWLRAALLGVTVAAAVALFFYVFTKGGLLLRRWRHGPRSATAHIYPMYSEMWLIRIVDFQPVISAILLGQYGRLVSLITQELRRMPLQGQDVLITSCAFGNVVPEVVKAALDAGAGRVKSIDLIANELRHAQGKLGAAAARTDFSIDDATALHLPSGSVAANVMFFLLHELEPEMKRQAIAEAVRVLAPDGKFFLAEFHKPDVWPLRALSWLYFKVFEPFGLALWDVQDPVLQLQALPGVHCERKTVCFGNFQVIVATRTA